MGNFSAFEQKMRAAGMGDAAIRAFRRNYEALLRNETGMIPEETISPPKTSPRSMILASTPPATPRCWQKRWSSSSTAASAPAWACRDPKACSPCAMA
jgi:hypothetical protein